MTRRRREAGVTTVEAAVAIPVMMLTVFVLLQGALWFNGREVAQGAATQAALTAAAHGADPAAADRAARDFLGGSSLRQATVTTRRTPTTVTVTVTGLVPALWAGLDWSTTQTATAGREVFTNP